VGKLVARVPGKVLQRVGDKVALRWSADEAHLFDAQTDLRVA
jgi:multiple sugar transport system ATP-binding protein